MRVPMFFLLFAALNLANLRAQPGTMGLGAGSQQSGNFNPSGLPNPDIDMSGGPSSSPTAAPQRLIFVSGTVAMDDGSSLPMSVDIVSVCGTKQRTVAHTASGGAFSFQWNSTETVIPEAADDGGRAHSASGTGVGMGELGVVGNCDLRAASSGYTSSRVDMTSGHTAGAYDAGTIVLHRLTGSEGRVVSVLALKAPKDAVKNFEKGNAAVRANKPADAAASYQKAVSLYPPYPDAWFNLGKVELLLGAKALAHEDFQKAMDLDAKLVGPWRELGYMASDESRWEQAANYLDQAVQLDPMGSTAAWYFNALANYYLRRFDAAEQSIRAEIKLNGDRNPLAEFLLGEILIGRQDLKGGAEVLRKYVQTWPQSDNVDAARQQLSRIESQFTSAAPPK